MSSQPHIGHSVSWDKQGGSLHQQQQQHQQQQWQQQPSQMQRSTYPNQQNPNQIPNPIPQYQRSSVIKSIKCQQCDATFATPSGLKFHMTKHGMDFQYHCPFCDKGLHATMQFKKHLKKHGGNGKTFYCCLCGTPFEKVKDFMLHVQDCKSSS